MCSAALAMPGNHRGTFAFDSCDTYSLNIMDECFAEITPILFTLSLGQSFIGLNSGPGRRHPFDRDPRRQIHMFFGLDSYNQLKCS